jgi:aminodeoxyfutalosine synthase
VEHLIQLRELQKKTGGFQALIPLSFHPTNTKLQKEGFVKNRVSSLEDLKMMAVSRLLLHNTIPNIRAYWVMLGKRLAQVSLHFGVNDLEGTVVEEKITHAAGATTDEFMTKEELINLIRDANMIPAERTTDYRVLRVYEQP